MIELKGRGVLDRPVKPGDDTVYRDFAGAQSAGRAKARLRRGEKFAEWPKKTLTTIRRQIDNFS